MLTASGSSGLRQIQLFQNLTGEQLEELSGLLSERTFPAGASIILSEQPGEVVFVVKSGTVKIYTQKKEGFPVALNILGAGEVLGEISALDGRGHSADVLALEPTTLLWMDRAAFWEYLETEPHFGINVALILCRRLRLATAKIQLLATTDAEYRVARQLMAFVEAYNEGDQTSFTLPFRLTQTDLADLVSLSRQSVNHIMGRFRLSGYLSVGPGQRITIHDRAALQCYCK